MCLPADTLSHSTAAIVKPVFRKQHANVLPSVFSATGRFCLLFAAASNRRLPFVDLPGAPVRSEVDPGQQA